MGLGKGSLTSPSAEKTTAHRIPPGESASPQLSVVVPVLHESHGINSLIAHVREVDPGFLTEIIVADGNPRGDTLQAITDQEVVKVFSAPGRGPQMNTGAARATGDILLFLHADTRLPDKAFTKAVRVINDQRYVAGAFRLGIDSAKASFRIIEFGAMVRSRFTRVPFGDQAIFMRKSYFQEMGGYRDIPIMEDVDLMVRIRARGHRICLLPEKVRTSSRRWEQEGILHCVLRNWILRASYVLRVPPEELAKFYKSGRPDQNDTAG